MRSIISEDEDYDGTVKAFMNGETVGQYMSNGDAWDSAAYSNEVPIQDVNGIDVIGDLSEDVLVYVDAETVREVDAEVPGRGHLDDVFEYEVDVEVVNGNGEVVQQDTGMFLSGGSEQVSPYVWAGEAMAKVTENESVNKVETGSNSGMGGELEFPLDEEENDDGLDVIQ